VHPDDREECAHQGRAAAAGTDVDFYPDRFTGFAYEAFLQLEVQGSSDLVAKIGAVLRVAPTRLRRSRS
jgi:hypothetical protein